MAQRISVLIAFIVFSLLFEYSVSMAQTIAGVDDIKKVVTFIFPPDAQGDLRLNPKTHNPTPYGTGFFVGVKNDTGSGSEKAIYAYLVTAKHITKDEHGNDFRRIYLRLNSRENDTKLVPVDLYFQNGQRAVYIHQDASVDIAVIPIAPSMVLFDFKVIPDDMLSTKATFDEFNIGEGSDVFFEGLFATYYGEHQNVPIFRFGRMAMFPDESVPWIDYEGQPQQHARVYLIEIQSYGGNSGSPVFFSLGASEHRTPQDGQPRLLLAAPPLLKLAGIMRGRFNDVQPIQILENPTAGIPVTTPNIGIAAVTPSYFLHDILFSDELKKLRAENPPAEAPQNSDAPPKEP